MGRRINISQPTVIETDLTPLSDNFFIEPSDTTEQWFYENHDSSNNGYSPDWVTTPLVLKPKVSAIDTFTGTEYTPNITQIYWYVSEYDINAGKFVETLITRTAENVPGEGYYIAANGLDLVVKKNMPHYNNAYGATVRCQIKYQDPRDAGVEFVVQRSISISANKDASVIYHVLDIDGLHNVNFHPLTDSSSLFSFNAKAYLGNEDKSSEVYFVWYAVDNDTNAEVLIDTLDCYLQAAQDAGKGQGTDRITIDAMYADNLTIVLRAKESQRDTRLFPSKAYATLNWKIPKMDAETACPNGATIRSGSSKLMSFEQLISIRGTDLSKEAISKHLAFLWKYRKLSATSTEASANVEVTVGWSPTIDIPRSTLFNATGRSTPVLAEIYLLSPYERVTWQNEDVTYNGEQVFARNVFS